MLDERPHLPGKGQNIASLALRCTHEAQHEALTIMGGKGLALLQRA